MTRLLRCFTLIAALLDLSACSEFSSKPSEVDAHFGEAVHAMQLAQTYHPETRRRPNDKVLLSRDGKKQQQILNSTYRQDVWQIESKRRDNDTNKFFPGMGDTDN